MAVPARVAADASAALDAGRPRANLDLRQAKARDCQLASARDCLWAAVDRERLVFQARRDVLESCRAPRLPDAWQQDVSRRPLLWVVSAQRVVSLQALLALPQAQPDESG